MHSTLARTAPAALQHLRRCSSRESFTPIFKHGRVLDPQRGLLIRWRSIWGKTKTGASQNQIRIVDDKTVKQRPMLVPNMLRRDLRCGRQGGLKMSFPLRPSRSPLAALLQHLQPHYPDSKSLRWIRGAGIAPLACQVDRPISLSVSNKPRDSSQVHSNDCVG